MTAQETTRRRWGIGLGLIVGLPVLVVAALVGALFLGHLLNNRSVPHFPSLVASPDASLHGTVAYVDSDTRCIRVIAASGATSKEVLCLEPMKGGTAGKDGKVGKEIGPQLKWLAGARLEVTMFWMTGKPPFDTAWQKVVDVRTGAVVQTPDADLPKAPDLTSGRATTSPTGQQVRFTSDGGNGKVKITLTENGTTRTLLSAQGPGEYTYGLTSVFWSPTWTWVAAHDDRILVVTTGPQPVTRVLVAHAEDAQDIPGYAVTAADLLTS
jgi:hypothetical protein